MRVLLLHPEDLPSRGPWSRQRWDLIVDLGKSSEFSEGRWSEQLACPVLRSDAFAQGVADTKRVREIFSSGLGRLIDEEGIDWWDVTSLIIAPEALALLILQRVAVGISPAAELWATRPGWPATVLAILLDRPLRTFEGSRFSRSVSRVRRYARLVRRFPLAQIKEIFLDKYDSDYHWRARFAPQLRNCPDPVVLLPSAYENVSRMAAAYARLLPQQAFLMVATRQNARRFLPPHNVQVRDLASYAADSAAVEAATLLDRWARLKAELEQVPELRVLGRVGVLGQCASRIQSGLSARNAWREVLKREPICGVLCGDDSNLYTRLPVLLAAHRRIPTVDFHHGAFDGRYLLKEMPCDLYLAKNEMERDYLQRICGMANSRIVIGAPSRDETAAEGEGPRTEGTSVIFFSEPYEVANMRVEEVYRELLPPLARLAREHGRSLIIKLHPFESRSQRLAIVHGIVSREERKLVAVLDGPLTGELLARTWFGVTVASTTAMDCQERGICCFLCGWLAHSPYEYLQQYSRFRVGEELESAEEINNIPERLAEFMKRSSVRSRSDAVDAVKLQQWLTSRSPEECGARSAS
jgi:hypothetical protein